MAFFLVLRPVLHIPGLRAHEAVRVVQAHEHGRRGRCGRAGHDVHVVEVEQEGQGLEIVLQGLDKEELR